MKVAAGECCGCGLCVAVCPQKCILMLPDAEGFPVPQVDESCCVQCQRCRKLCPVNREPAEAAACTPADPHCFYAISADAGMVAAASSGGIFPQLASRVLAGGGAVVGAAFDENWDVRITLIEDAALLVKLMQAKYVQAETPPELFRDAAQILKAGRQLLYTGTPCQIAAFRRFLGPGEWPGLLCAEVICHSVASPAVWRSYVRHTAGLAGSPVQAAAFRDKVSGWHQFSLTLDCGGRKYQQTHRESPYMRLFLRELISRKSCAACGFKQGSSGADMSLGDFWKLRKIAPAWNNDTGASMVIVHTEKGRAALAQCEFAAWQEFPMDVVKISNRAFYQSTPPHALRDDYFAAFAENGMQWFDPGRFFQKQSRFARLRERFFRWLAGGKKSRRA
ncbi:MAG: Coenzyme F420 hydrogenase/dehydrogenase, beta subunit C-terminal domain [Lentisphaeria bacterium]|nr:Coenzyme F420 hydrogenase/dehydrogenase, beta subunit C-terminal domain [Lentisphaeria bacterium]